MIDLLKWAINRQEKSKDSARRRLQVILLLDRVRIAPERMEALRQDILQTVSNYLVVDESSVAIEMQRLGQAVVLVSNIQVRDVMREVAAA